MLLSPHLEKLSIIMLLMGEAFVAYQLALLTWFLLSPPLTVAVWTAPIVTQQQQDMRLRTQILQSVFLFGQQKIAPQKITQKSKSEIAPKTTLKLTLVGVVAASDPAYSSAIITYEGQQDSYFIDSTLANNQASILEILADRIILNVRGARQTLMLDGAEEEFDNMSSVETKMTTSVITLNLDRNMLLKNPSSILNYINIYPIKDAGRMQGYRLSPGRNPELFSDSGLHTGDLAVQLNGVDLTDRQKSLALMKDFKTMTEMKITVQRQGELYDIYFAMP
ncbi:type II secretion system protein GspC [Psychromonas sp. CD1]|uniref:type II secretion system protein GspC n=1 Tax=Psychromonas sp. CD1 TaxID=1979839 RepID=UPI0015DA7576|nr:type II secretion system protein GspC [Psychromonas sp. CD1]